jgi:hypothetical protein
VRLFSVALRVLGELQHKRALDQPFGVRGLPLAAAPMSSGLRTVGPQAHVPVLVELLHLSTAPLAEQVVLDHLVAESS